MITVKKLDESFLRLECDTDIAYELSEAFTFEVPGAKYTPLYKAGVWDGRLKIFNLGKRTLPFGLLTELKKFGQERNYEIVVEDFEYTTNITLLEVEEYCISLQLEKRVPPISIRDYQVNAVYQALKNKRGILLAATGSGKSMVLYTICRYLTEVLNLRVLIIVPTVGLTTQLKSDFADYAHTTGWDADKNIHCIYAGVDKAVSKPITISTFQSIYKMPPAWLNQFGAIIGDEAHKVIAKTITGIYEKATKVEYKLGCTGTLHSMKCDILVMKGITGEIYEIATTSTLIDNKQLVPLEIKALILNYPESICKAFKGSDYDTEIKYIVSNPKRNNFIANLALKCPGTVLVLFRFVDAQGMPLFKILSEKANDRQIHYVDGTVSMDTRETIRVDANDSDDIIVASYPTFATGINLPAISSIIFASPVKSPITILQSVGRGLRLAPGKKKCTLYDLSDNITYKRKPNITYRHLGERLKTYTLSNFSFNIVNIPFDV